MTDINALYLIMLAAVAGYVLIARVPAILHTPTMSGSNFIHGIVLVGAIVALGSANATVEKIIGFVAVTAAAANVVGGFVVTDRMLALFQDRDGESSIDMVPEIDTRLAEQQSGNDSASTTSAISSDKVA